VNIQVIAVGKIKEQYLQDGIEEYRKRIQRYGRLQIIEVKEESFNEPLSPRELELVLQREGERLLGRINPRAYVIALDRLGQAWSSEQLAKEFQTLAVAGTSQIDFIIGGSLGLDQKVLERAQTSLSFSGFTFPHQLMRLILAEQIYRAFTIVQGERYHK